MQELDWNLLPVLHALLHEQNVTRAAERVHRSVPATSRALDRARRSFGDPLLVRHGRGVVMTPAAHDVKARLDDVVAAVDRLMSQPQTFDASALHRTFVVRANEAVIAEMGGPLVQLAKAEAPHVVLRFEGEAIDDIAALRAGDIDMAIGSYSDVPREVHTRFIATEHVVGIVRAGHPAIVSKRRPSVKAFAALDHVVVSRRGRAHGPIDSGLAELGLTRRVIAVVPSFSSAIAMVMGSDATAMVSERFATAFARTGGIRLFPIPVPVPEVDVHLIWHARFSNDPAHEWLHDCAARSIS